MHRHSAPAPVSGAVPAPGRGGPKDTDGRQSTNYGYGILRDEQGLFLFRATPAPAEGKS